MNKMLRAAQNDYDLVVELFPKYNQDERFANYVCLAILQAIEKLIKSQLDYAGVPYPYTHDIKKLMKIATKHGYTLPKDLKLLATSLTFWSVETRYEPDFAGDKKIVLRAIAVYHELLEATLQLANTSKISTDPDTPEI